jgi:hypothetical protein
MTHSDPKSKVHFGGPGSVDLAEGLRLLKAYLTITNPAVRASALDYIERLAATQKADTGRSSQ